ncbi:MAG: CRTAC1 family protein [Planctomycetota bacterium]|nr:CRTAC1 family protein [Planctomycetota bacterium]
MLAILEQIKERAPADFPFFGHLAHIQTRRELEALGPDDNPLKRFALLQVLGSQELHYEESPRLAIQHLTEAYELFPRLELADADGEYFEAWNRTIFFLAVAWLRLGETENCCARHGSDSCILPIRGGGVHADEQGSRQAIKYFQQVLENVSNGKSSNKELGNFARWLLNIAYMTLAEYPQGVPQQYLIPPEYFQSEVEFPRFENVAPKLGLDTYNQAGGVIVDDFDNDDYLDILTSSSNPNTQTRFFRNNRDGTFTDRTKEAGLTGMYGGLNMVQADYDNDGNLDVLILRGAWHHEFGNRPNSLLRNNGNATFTDMTFEAGLGERHYPTKTASWADYDNDGNLDLFIGNEDSREFDAPCQLFRNNGNGTFTDVAAQAGVQSRVYSMATVWGDYDNDRYPDLYLAGDAPPDPRNNRLFRNNGDGTFTDVAVRLGLTRPQYSFPAWFWDFDNDGNLDLYISSTRSNVALLTLDALNADATTDSNGIVRGTIDDGVPNAGSRSWKYELPGLYRGNGQGGLEDVAAEQNLDHPTQPMGANFGDVNGDGYLDFYLATGDVPYWELRPNLMFLNNAGRGFYNVTMGGGFGHLQKGHGVSFVDLDNDGDQDVYVQMGGQLPGDKYYDALFENPGFGHRWITIKLVGHQSNHSAIGARIHVTIVEDGKPRSIYRHVNSGGSFGCNPLRQNIGLGKAESIESIEVYWPTSDSTQTFRNVAMDQAIQIAEGETQFKTIKLNSFILGRD